MLDLPALGATFLLLFYAVYAASRLVPAEHPRAAVVLNILAMLVGVIGASPWNPWLPRAPWTAQLLIIAIAAIATVWRHEAATFLRRKFEPGAEAKHPVRRKFDHMEGPNP